MIVEPEIQIEVEKIGDRVSVVFRYVIYLKYVASSASVLEPYFSTSLIVAHSKPMTLIPIERSLSITFQFFFALKLSNPF